MIDGNTALDLSKKDTHALVSGRACVFTVLKSGKWLTLYEVQREVDRRWGVHYSESCISARIRDFRKVDHGGHIVNRRARHGRLYEYQLQVKP